MDLFSRTEPDLRTEDSYHRQAPLPELRIRELTGQQSSLNKRDSSNGSSASQSAGGSDLTPIVIGVVVPVLIIAIILFVVWRRRSKITKQEESHDKYRSLDFGIDPAVTHETKRRKPEKRAPEMAVNDLKSTFKKDRGLSMDLSMTNPYLLPPEVQQSRESLHSLSRSINTGDDKYRATTFIPDDGSIRSPSSLRSGHDSSSIFTGSTKRHDTESKTDLLPRPLRDVHDPSNAHKPFPALEKPQAGFLAPMMHDQDRNSTLSTGSGVAALRASNNYLGKYISGGGRKDEPRPELKSEDQPGLMVTSSETTLTPSPEELRQPEAAVVRDAPSKRASSFYANHTMAELADTDQHSNREPTLPQVVDSTYELDSSFNATKYPQRHQSRHAPELYDHTLQDNIPASDPIPTIHSQITHDRDDDQNSDYYEDADIEDYQDYIDYTYRGSTMGVRPLPPDDPSENPEQRANRIRSFYKEYFDDGSGGSKTGTSQAHYYDGSEQYEDDVYGYYERPPPSVNPDGRHRAMSQGNPVYRGGPRAFSSMSGRNPVQRMAPKTKKQLPPPKPLMLLPTPHKLKDGDFLPNAIDFAPPQVFKNQRAGTPDSLRGGMRPYSPSVRPHVPLTSSFDDLAVIPSPHSLRKSGTFTNLQFAPPRRFKEVGESMSETGSIRSNKSNLSQMHLANIRNGAYRVSRIPKDVAGTRDDMYAALRPKWDMRGDSVVPSRQP